MVISSAFGLAAMSSAEAEPPGAAFFLPSISLGHRVQSMSAPIRNCNTLIPPTAAYEELSLLLLLQRPETDPKRSSGTLKEMPTLAANILSDSTGFFVSLSMKSLGLPAASPQ